MCMLLKTNEKRNHDFVLYSADTSITEANTLANYFIHLQQIEICLKYTIPVLANFDVKYNKDISLLYMQEFHAFNSVTSLPCSSRYMFGDAMTKQENDLKHIQSRSWYVGKHFHAPVNTHNIKI